MAQDELNLTYTEAYFQDRVGELRNQVANGDPFVFLGALILLNSIASLAGRSVAQILPDEYDDTFKALISNMSPNLYKFFALHFDGDPNSNNNIVKLAFTHEDSLHLKVIQSNDFTVRKCIISANGLLDTVTQVVKNIFGEASTNKWLALRLYLNINERRLFGHGK